MTLTTSFSKTPAAAVAIIGFGEVGPIFAAGLAQAGCRVAVYDIKFDTERERAMATAQVAPLDQVSLADSLQHVLREATLVFSAVTASQSLTVAAAAAAYLHAGQTFIDINSVSPGVKQQSRDKVEASGAEYVEAAVMAPVPPQGLRVPILLGGRSADTSSGALNALGMKTRPVAREVGMASAIKLCRSIMIKGMEALCVQSMLAGRRQGVDAFVLESLAASFPCVGWDNDYEAYLIGRVVQHGQRRSEEMREAATMLRDLGMDASLAEAVADLQERLAREAAPLVAEIDSHGRLANWRMQLADKAKPAG